MRFCDPHRSIIANRIMDSGYWYTVSKSQQELDLRRSMDENDPLAFDAFGAIYNMIVGNLKMNGIALDGCIFCALPDIEEEWISRSFRDMFEWARDLGLYPQYT